MSKLTGRFFFKLTDSKNLIGEFSNKDCKRNYTESADLRSGKPDDGIFIGTYYSTWHEEKDGKAILAELKIEQKYGNIFTLTWSIVQDGKPAARPTFHGEGMLCDGILIGDYQGIG